MEEGQFPLEVVVHDWGMAAEIEEKLRDVGAHDIAREEGYGLFPVLPVVIAAILGAGGLASVISWLIRRHACQVLIDARGDTVRKEVDCRVRDGRLIVLASDGVRVEIAEVPNVVDLTEITTAAMTAGADAVQAAAEAVGAKAEKV